MAEDRIPRRTLIGLILGTLAAGSGLAAAIALLFENTDRNPQEVMTAAQKILRQRFPQAAEVRFAPSENTRLESKGENTYVITGWMEVIDPDGARATFDYSCVMLTVPGGHWISESVELVPRP